MSIKKRTSGQRRGIQGYLAVLHLLAQEPSTATRLGERMQASHQGAMVVLRALHAMRLIHVGGWADRVGQGFHKVAVWHAGEGRDIPAPDGGLNVTSSRAKNLTSTVVALAAFLRTMEQPSSVRQLIEATGMTEMTVGEVLRCGRGLGMFRIADWDILDARGNRVPLWQIGKGLDKPWPKAFPKNALQREYEARNRERWASRHLQHALAAEWVSA